MADQADAVQLNIILVHELQNSHMKYGDGDDTVLIPTPFLNAGDSKDKLLLHYIFNKKCAPDKCLAQSQYCSKSVPSIT
jgi:hypothetical protein